MSGQAQRPDELFDVVDALDRVVGRAGRAHVHANGLLHRAVHILWVREDGLLCLQRRSYAKDTCPGLLSSSCAGHLDAGEAYPDAAVRELAEELGITVDLSGLREIDACPAHPDLGQEFVRVYRMDGAHAARPHPGEVDSLLWRSPAEVETWARRQPAAFSSSLLHLLARGAVRDSLGLAGGVEG